MYFNHIEPVTNPDGMVEMELPLRSISVTIGRLLSVPGAILVNEENDRSSLPRQLAAQAPGLLSVRVNSVPDFQNTQL
jgi:hypothetical protein